MDIDIRSADVSSSAGPLLLGYLMNWGLFGVLSCQVYIYYFAFPRDSKISKALVYGIYLLEATQTMLITHDAFDTYARNFGDLNSLNSLHLEWLAVPVLSGTISCSVQIYYGYRLFFLTGSKLLSISIVVIALLQGSSAITQGVQAFFTGKFSYLATETPGLTTTVIWLGGSAACDAVITVSMTIVLVRMKAHVNQIKSVIAKIICIIVETGCLTAIAAILDLTLFLSFPHKSHHATVATVLAKLYSNSLLVIFNNRLRIVDGRSEISESKVTFNWMKSNIRPHDLTFASRSRRGSQSSVAVLNQGEICTLDGTETPEFRGEEMMSSADQDRLSVL